MTRRRTLATALLALLALGSGAPALAAPADVTSERMCVFLGSDPADRQGLCVYFPGAQR